MNNETNLETNTMTQLESDYRSRFLELTLEQISNKGYSLIGDCRYYILRIEESQDSNGYDISFEVRPQGDTRMINTIKELMSVPGEYKERTAHIINANAQDVINVVLATTVKLEEGKTDE